MTDEEIVANAVTARLTGKYEVGQPVYLKNGVYGKYAGFYRGPCLTGGVLFEFTGGNRLGVSIADLEPRSIERLL